MGELEGWGSLLRVYDGNVDALPCKNVVEVVEVKSRDVPFEKSFTLSELVLDALCMPSWGQGLPMSILLMAGSACSCAGGASGVFRVALDDISGMVSDVRVGQWKLPSVSPDGTCLYFFASTPCTGLMGASETARFRWGLGIIGR